MFELLIPFLAIRLFERKKLCREACRDLWAIAVIALLSKTFPLVAILLWIPLSLWQFFCFAISYRFQIAPSLHLSKFLLRPKAFASSLKSQPIVKYCLAAFALTASSIPAFLSKPFLPFWIPLFLFSSISLIPRRKKNGKASFSFPNETFIPLSPKYPLLRKTVSYEKEKEFDISIARDEKPHIIFLFLESFRATNIGSLGAKIPASPHFDSWAKKGILFQNFYATGLQTYRAFISAYFGIPAHLPGVNLKPFCSLPLIGLPQILKEEGYHNALIQSSDLSFDSIYPFFKSHGFETIFGAENMPIEKGRLNSWGLKDESTVRFAVKWLKTQTSPVFLSLFTINNHHPWKSPSDWGFVPPPNLPPPYPDFLKTFAYTDHCLHLFLSGLEEQGLLDKSVVFITGDHGQEMGERRPFSEMNHSLFEENIHLPLLILAKGAKPQMVDKASSMIDLAPTVFDILNLQPMHHGLGKSLLRKTFSPVYFSLQRGDTEFGCIEDGKKVIVTKRGILGFDLKTDGEEKIDIGKNLLPLAEKSDSFFQSVDTMYQTKTFAPDSGQNTLFEMKADEKMDDSKWLAHLKKRNPISSLDLSSSLKLTDRAILDADPKLAKHWHRVNLAHSARITDKSLHWLSHHSPHLMHLNLSYCHLITDEGIKELLSQCKELRYLIMPGVYDLFDYVPENISLLLHTFLISRISSQSLLNLFENAFHLIDWSVSLEHADSKTLLSMSRHKKECTRMELSEGFRIDDLALSSLLKSQELLQEVSLSGFPLLNNPDFSSLKKLRYLHLSDCPLINDSFFDRLDGASLIRLKLERCPNITREGLNALVQKSKAYLFLNECDGVSPEDILSLRNKGASIF